MHQQYGAHTNIVWEGENFASHIPNFGKHVKILIKFRNNINVQVCKTSIQSYHLDPVNSYGRPCFSPSIGMFHIKLQILSWLDLLQHGLGFKIFIASHVRISLVIPLGIPSSPKLGWQQALAVSPAVVTGWSHIPSKRSTSCCLTVSSRTNISTWCSA